MRNSATYLNRTPIFEWCVVCCGSLNIHLKEHVFKRDWIACSQNDVHSRFDSQCNWKDLYDQLDCVLQFS